MNIECKTKCHNLMHQFILCIILLFSLTVTLFCTNPNVWRANLKSQWWCTRGKQIRSPLRTGSVIACKQVVLHKLMLICSIHVQHENFSRGGNFRDFAFFAKISPMRKLNPYYLMKEIEVLSWKLPPCERSCPHFRKNFPPVQITFIVSSGQITFFHNRQ